MIEMLQHAYTERQREREAVMRLYSDAYDFLVDNGQEQHVVPDNTRTIKVTSSERTQNGITYRLWYDGVNMRPDTKFGDPNNGVRQIVLESRNVEDKYSSWFQIASLRIISRENGPEEAGSELLGNKLSDDRILVRHTVGLVLTREVLEEIFGVR